jgi:hypothetical protein
MAAQTRRVALLVWIAALVLPAAFLPVVWRDAGGGGPARLADLFLLLAAVASALAVTLARFVAPRLGGASGNAEAVAFTRLLVAWALCEAAAIFPLVAYVLTADGRLLLIFAVDLLALALLWPSDRRFQRLRPAPGGAAAPRVVH